MTLVEAERASSEIAMSEKASEHDVKLNKAIKELDLKALDEVLDEGTIT